MPYDSVSDLPDQTDDLSTEQKRAFLKAFNYQVLGRVVKMDIDKHLQGEHDQQTHDPTRSERVQQAADRIGHGIRDTRNKGVEGAAEQVANVRRRGADVFDEANTKELVQMGAYSGMAGAATVLARHYSRHPTAAMAYGAYALATAALAGLTFKDVEERVGKALKVEVEEPTKKVISALSRKTGAEPEQLLEDLGEWLVDNDVEPDDITPMAVKTFLAEYEVSKGVTPEMAAAFLGGELAT